jgi:hypothetical protein
MSSARQHVLFADDFGAVTTVGTGSAVVVVVVFVVVFPLLSSSSLGENPT